MTIIFAFMLLSLIVGLTYAIVAKKKKAITIFSICLLGLLLLVGSFFLALAP